MTASLIHGGGCTLERSGSLADSSLGVGDDPAETAPKKPDGSVPSAAPSNTAEAPTAAVGPRATTGVGGSSRPAGSGATGQSGQPSGAPHPMSVPGSGSTGDDPTTPSPDDGSAPSDDEVDPGEPGHMTPPTTPAPSEPSVEPPVSSPPVRPTQPPYGFQLTSTAIQDGGSLAARFACDGVVPPLQWTGAPTGTVGYTVALVETEAGIVWIAPNLPAAVTSLPRAGADVQQLRFGCQPGTHRYQFIVQALGSRAGAGTPATTTSDGVTRTVIAGGQRTDEGTPVVLGSSILSADLTVR